MRIDTHAHLYADDDVRYPMKAEPYRPERGVGTIDHLCAEVAANGIDRVVLVQTGSAYGWDNRLLADVARAHPGWTVGVCTLDPVAEKSLIELERLVGEYNVKGVRIEVANGRYRHAGSERLWALAGQLGAVVCAHLRREYLEELDQLLIQFPDVPVVLDHCAYPSVDEDAGGDVLSRVKQLAMRENLYAKLTFGVTSSQEEYPFVDTWDMLRCVIDAFGPERCMWGSDFPCEHWLRKASYAQHVALFTEELGLSDTDLEWVLGGTASRVFWEG